MVKVNIEWSKWVLSEWYEKYKLNFRYLHDLADLGIMVDMKLNLMFRFHKYYLIDKSKTTPSNNFSTLAAHF